MRESAAAIGPQPRFDDRLDRCPLCESTSIRPYLTDHRGIAIDLCRACRVRFMNPQYTQESLDEYYTRYTSHDPSHIVAAHRGPRRERKRANLDLLAKHLPPRARFLGLGCGDGLELTLAKERGYEVEAYDVDPAAASAVREATGIEVRTGDLFTIPLERGAYDCVFLDQVLEHPKDPARYLRRIRDLLRERAILYLGVPNLASLSNRWKTLQDRLGVRNGSRKGRHFDTWHHLLYYSPRSLRRVLPQFGFDVLEVRGDPESTAGTLLRSVRRTVPLLESSMIVIARKR